MLANQNLTIFQQNCMLATCILSDQNLTVFQQNCKLATGILSYQNLTISQKIYILVTQLVSIPRGLTARIPGSHPGGPGSTPGVGIF